MYVCESNEKKKKHLKANSILIIRFGPVSRQTLDWSISNLTFCCSKNIASYSTRSEVVKYCTDMQKLKIRLHMCPHLFALSDLVLFNWTDSISWRAKRTLSPSDINSASSGSANEGWLVPVMSGRVQCKEKNATTKTTGDIGLLMLNSVQWPTFHWLLQNHIIKT